MKKLRPRLLTAWRAHQVSYWFLIKLLNNLLIIFLYFQGSKCVLRHHGGVLGPRRRGPSQLVVRDGALCAAQQVSVGPAADQEHNQH